PFMLASPFANSSLPDYVAACNPAALAGARIGVPANVLELNAPYLASAKLSAFHAALPILAAAGATIVPDANFTAFAEYAASNSETLVLNADFLANLRAYLATLTVNPTDLADLAGVRAITRAFGPEDYCFIQDLIPQFAKPLFTKVDDVFLCECQLRLECLCCLR
ncbi:hypothetical protein SLS56_012181, partial [Neofusicoccum ribis]